MSDRKNGGKKGRDFFSDGLMAFCKYGASEHQGVFNWTRFFFHLRGWVR